MHTSHAETAPEAATPTPEHELPTAEAPASEAPAEEAAGVEVVDWQDRYIRLYAEFDNFRKRTTRERADLIRQASREVLERLLPVVDDFERAAAAAGTASEAAALVEGQTLILNKLRHVLESQGVASMGVTAGATFDVDVHEAITNVPAPSPELVGKVVDVVEQGYLLHGNVLRYAKVVVGA
jgi:molecular chaperone GrpE